MPNRHGRGMSSALPGQTVQEESFGLQSISEGAMKPNANQAECRRMIHASQSTKQ